MENILNTKKILLENYHDQLSSNNTQLKILRDQIELKKKVIAKEQDDLTSEQNKIRFDHAFLIEERKAQFFKLLNLENSGFKIFSNMTKFESTVDSLIKVILDIVDNNLTNFSMLDYEDVKMLKIDDVKEKNFQNVRKSLFTANNLADQNLIDQITTKMIEFNYVEKDFIDKCVLFKRIEHLKDNQYAIYHYMDIFLVLKLNISVDNEKNKCKILIQNLLYEEYLSFLCEHIYCTYTGLDVKSSDITALFNCYKDITKFDLKKDEEEKIFLQKITDYARKKNANAYDKLVYLNLSFLNEYYDGLEDHSEEHIEFKESISFWKSVFCKRMAYILNEETEKRKHLSLSKIESANHSDTLLDKQFDLYNQKMEQLESSISEKMNVLQDIDYKIVEKQEQASVLKKSYAEQIDELDAEISRMDKSLKIKEEDLKAIEESDARQKDSLKKLETNIEQVKSRKLELEKKANVLRGKINELKKNENTLLKDKAQYVSEISCCNSERKLIQDQHNQLEKQIQQTEAWKKFIEMVHNRLLDDGNAFQKRTSLVSQLKGFKDLNECCRILAKELNIDLDGTVEQIASQNEPKKRVEIESCLQKVLAEPNVTLEKDNLNNQNLISIDALNIHFEHVINSLGKFLANEMDKFDLYFTENILRTKSNDMTYDNFFKQDLDESLKRLIDKKLRINYLFQEIYETENFFLEPNCLLHNENNKEKPIVLGSMKLNEILSSIQIEYKEFFAQTVKSVKILAGHNIFVTENDIELKGTNLAMIAAQNIVLPEAVKIDTSGHNGQQFKYDQAFSFSSIQEESEALTCGKNGVNGFDGACGQNGGHIYLRAENQIINLDKIELLNSRGGNGAVGQKGGNGQKGGKGQDIGDAKAEDFAMCIKNPGFSAAFAREPGFSLETGDFTLTSEISGNGGDAGQAGFGGQEGFFGEITLIDCDDNLSTNTYLNSGEKFESSASLKPFLDSLISSNKILMEKGEQGKNAEINGVDGGDAGEPGTYGNDNVIYDSGLFSRKVNLKGDFSNYLGNGGSESIFEKPDSYALNSIEYNFVKVVGACISYALLWFLVPLSGLLFYQTFSGLKVEQRQSTAVKNKNHKGEIQFKNRYCDRKAIEHENDMTDRRRTDKSKGKRGENSQLKKETSRQGHNKASACKNLFTDNSENALDMKKLMELQNDVSKERTIESLKNKVEKDKENNQKLSQTLDQIEKNMQKLNSKKESVEKKLEQNQLEQKNLRSQLEQTNSSIDQCENEEQDLQNLYLNETWSYLDLVEQKSAKQIQIDLSVSELQSKNEVKNAIGSCFTQIKSHIELTSEQLSSERAGVLMNLEKLESEKKSIEIKKKNLLVQQLDNVKFQSDQTKEINKLNEIQKNVLNEENEQQKSELSEQTMLIEEFKTDKAQGSVKNRPELIQIHQRSIMDSKFKSLFSFFTRFNIFNKAPNLEDLISHIVKTQSLVKSNDMLGKLEFVIEAMPFLKENDQFSELIKIFNAIVENDSKFKILYRQIAINYWALENVEFETNQENEIDESLANYSLQVFYSKRDTLSPLEQLISNFIVKKTASFYSIQNLNSTQQLLKDYYDLMKNIADSEYTGIKILKRSANNFYTLFIQTLFATIENGAFDYKELEQIINVFKILNDNIIQINNFEIWSKRNLFKDQLNMLNRFAPNIEFCLSNLKYLSDSLEDSSISSSKKELLENYLFSKLVHVLQNKINKDNFEKIKLKINGTKIENSNDKCILIEEFESNENREYYGLSLNSFVIKYKYLLNSEQKTTLINVTQNVIQYCLERNSNERLKILIELIFLINYEHLSFMEIISLLKKLTTIKYGLNSSMELFLVRLGKILAKKAENELVNKVNSFEFNRIFYECVKNRLKNVPGSFVQKINDLVPFYEQVNKLLVNYSNEAMSEGEHEFEKNVTLVLNYANSSISYQNLSRSEIKLLKSICPNIDENMDSFEIIESLIFDLANIQYSLFSLSSKDKKDKTKKIFESIFKKIEKIDSENLLIRSIKQHVESIDKNLKKKNRIEVILKNLDNVNAFVSFIIKLVDKNQLKKDHLLEEIDSSLKIKFHNKYDQQVGFVIDCINYCSKPNQSQIIELFFDLAKLLDIDQLFYQDKIDCIFCLYEIFIESDKKSKQSEHIDKFEKKIHSAFNEVCGILIEKCQKISNKRSNENSEQIFKLIQKLFKNLLKQSKINMSQLKDLFRMMVKIKECLNQFYYEINNFSSEIDLTKSEKKMTNDVAETLTICLSGPNRTIKNNDLINMLPDCQAKFDVYLCFLQLKFHFEPELSLKDLEDNVLNKIHQHESEEIVSFFANIYYIIEDNCLVKINKLKENIVENMNSKKAQLNKIKTLICEQSISKVNKNQNLSNRINFLNSLLNRCLAVEGQLSTQEKIVFFEKLRKKIETMQTYSDIEKKLIDLANLNNFKDLTTLFDPKMSSLFKENYGHCACIDDLFDILFTNSNNILNKIIQSTNEEHQAEYLQLAIDLLGSFYFSSFHQQEKIEALRIELLESLDQQTVGNISSIEQLNQLMIKTCFKINDYQNYEQVECDSDIILLTEKIYFIFEKVEKFFKDLNLIIFNDQNLNVSKISFIAAIESDMKTFAANVHTLKKSDAVELIDKLVDKIEKLIADAFKKTDLMEQRTRAEHIITSNDSKLIIDEIQIRTLYLLDEPIFYSETSLAHACLALMLEEMSNAGKFSPACNQQLLNGIKCLKQLKDLRLSFYSFHFLTNYLETLLDTNFDQIVQTDCCFIDLMLKVFSINSSEKAKYIDSVIVALDNSNITKYFSQLDFILPLLSSKALDRDKIKNTLLKLANNPGEFSARICFILLTFYHKHTNFKNKKLNLFMKRILKSFGESEKIGLVKFYFECDEHIEKNNSIQNLSSIKNYLCDILSTHELTFLKYMDPNLVVKDVLEKHFDYIWIEVMEGMFISLMSNKILVNEQNVLLDEIQNLEEDSHSLESKLKQLVDCSYFTQCDLDFNFFKSKKINYPVLNSIKNFKINLILSKEIFVDKQIWIEFIDGLARSNKDLSVTTKLLSFSPYFYPIEKQFNELLNNCESKYLISYFLLESVKNLFSTILSHSSTNFELDLAAICDCLESNFLKGDSDNDYYLEWLASKLLNEVNKKTKLQISEIEAIKNMLHNGFCLGINQSGGQSFLNRLEKLAILKWNNLIKIELIKKELNRPECDKLAKDIVCLEDVRGKNLVTELMTVLKSVPLDQFTLSTIIEKFKKNEWDLNFKIVKLMKDTTSSDWIKKISEHDQNEKKKEMSVQELIELMRQKEAPNEANYNVRDLICVNRESNQCLLEQCLYEIEEKKKLKSVIDIDIEKSIVEYDELDVKKWTNTYKLLSKVNVDSILCNEVVELCCVLSRGSKLTFGYELRSTQLIALILFIDAMLKKRGRLANISTGEGKSVITIVTAIAHLLVRGGTVDILTSSELLAERDAIESEHFFKLFNLNVSNNCDLDASQYEHVRQNRYQNNQVIYGVIGNFQRDVLLTKYYAKPIRKELATCLIVDEVDSMCIDNMCNTLYISHQIADLKYLKDVYVYIWQAVNMFDTAEYTVKNVEKIKSFIELKIKESQIVYPASLQEMIERKIKIWIENAYLAKTTIQEGDQYSIISKGRQSGQAVINDLQTGIEQLNTQWSDGLQQFIQLKHYNKLSEESLKSIFMSNYIFFKQYNDNIFGMTGTLGASQERDLLSNAYGLDFFHLPRFKRELNVRHNDFVLATRSAWLAQIKQSVDSYLANNRIIEKKEIDDSKSMLQSVLDEKALLDHNIENLTIMLNEAKLAEIDESQLSQREKEEKCQGLQTELNNLIKLKDDHDMCIESLRDVLGEDMSRNSGGRAVLVICKNKKDVNDVVRNLLVNHKHLFDFNGKLDGLRKVDGLSKRAATEIRQLRPGDVVVATNVAGRGTDFKLSDLLLKNGGLHVILSYVPDNERVELQAFGRSGRKGQPGSGNLIVYDKRLFSNHELTVDLLKQERDADEEERLMEIRIKMIPRVIIEKKLFEKFEMLQDRIKEYIYTKFQDSKFNELMIKSLHNKWAFWLEKMSSLINNVYRSNENEEEIFNCFDNFAAKIVKEFHRDINGIQGLIDEPSELIKLAKYNILSEKFDQAIKNCDAIIDNNCIEMCAFAYLYKAIALFRPVNNIGTELVDQLGQNFNGGFKIISEKNKKDGIQLLKMSIELFQKEIQRIQMRSQVLCKIGQEKIKYGVGSKADHFSKSNANEISVLQIHLNAAQCALKSPIDCLKLSNCLNSTKLFNRLSDDDEKKACEIKKSLFEAIIDDCQSNKLIKKVRFSKKCILKCHINFKNREKMVMDIIGEQLVQKAEKTPECFVLNQIDSCLEQKLKSNLVDYSKEIYMRDLIDPSGFRHVKLPSQFFYLKERLLKQLENIHGQTTNERENVVNNLSKECLSFDKVFDIICQKFCLQNVKCVLLHQEFAKYSTNENVWQNDMFGDWANSIRNVLPKLFESNQCVEYSNLVNLIKEKLMEDKTQNQKQLAYLDVVEITNHLFKKNILVLEEKFKFPNEIQHLIKEFKNSLCFRQNITFDNIRQHIECVDLSDFTRLSEKKEEIIDFFEKKLRNTQKKISREEFEEEIFGQNSDEYSYGFIKILLTLKKVFSSLDEWLDINLTSSHLDENEIIEVNNIVLELANLEYFNKQNISLIPLNSLIEYFIGEKVVKDKSFSFKYQLSPEKMAKELRDKIKYYAQKHVSELIDKYIENGQYLTEADLKDLKSTIEDKILNFSKKKLLRYNEKKILENIRKKTRSNDIEEMSNLIVSSLMDTIGELRLNEKCYITCNLLNSILKETNLPREAQEFIQDGKDLVISFSKYNSPWSWKATCIMALGVVQISAGCLLTAYPILGPFSFHIGSGLISEGCGDIMFALNNAANITTTTYLKHKAISMLITCVCVGIGGYLSRASSVSNVSGKTIQEQAVRLGSQFVTKKNSYFISGAIAKKVMLEINKNFMIYFKGVAVNILSSMTSEFIKQMLRQFPKKIISLIRHDQSYNLKIEKLGSSVKKLLDIVKKRSYRQSTKQILDEKLRESIQQYSEKLNNGIGNIIAQVAGPFSSQFGLYQASKEVQFSDLNENNQNQSGNSWTNFLNKIAFIIDKAMKFIKSVKIVYDIICTGRDIANLTNEKISKKINNINNSAKRNSNESQTRVENASTEQTSEAYESQHTVLIETRSVNNALKLIKDKEEEPEEETEMENESETKPKLNPEESQEIEKYIENVNQSILDTISKKIEESIVKPAFTSLISFSLGSLYKKLDDRFGQDLENIKKISVVYGEYQTRNKNNSQEIDIKVESARDFLINEPNSLPIDTPIYDNLEKVKCGQVNLMIKGEIKVLDLSNEEDCQFIRDQISEQGIRFFTTQKGMTLSKPNFLNYINSITAEKRFTEYELDILAQQFNVKIGVITNNQQVTIGSNEGQNEGEIYISLKNGHFEPMIKCDDKYVLISDLESPEKKCGPHAFFYAMKMNDLMKKKNMSFGDSDKQTRDNIDIEVDKMLQNMQEYAKNSEYAWQLFVQREHEGTSIVSGNKRNQNSLPLGQAFFAGNYIKKYQIEKNIKQDTKDLVKIFEKYIDKAMQPETRENRKKKANDYIEQNWNRNDNSKTQMIIEFLIVKPKDDKQNKIIFAFGKTPLYNKQLTDDNMKITELLTNQTGEQKAIIDIRETSNFKTKNGFEFIYVGFKYNDSGVRACITAKALEYLKEKIGLSNVKSFELGEIIYEYDNTGPRTQPNINGIEFATSFEGCQTNFTKQD